ncbi:TetR/AcrR family transcriptional regulator [Svornostia abyssi]|uniref:TetR/AcrR family transcriptional regulator n=1 Tax=Svornostia abyssi TaxID=2898438 RepID=A0ABY5PHC0_9ACTN|nr:TetR/AcrR family transcriptional regulator [Parviterribacteraceae bacterium J379]
MSTPTSSRAERMRLQLREEIVQTAAEVFAERGYHRTGIADIAQRLGVGNSSIYAHFAGKRALFDVVIDDAMSGVMSLLTAENAPAAADTFEDYQEQVRRIASGFTVALRDDPAVLRLLRALLVEAGGVDEELAGKASAFTDAATQVTAAYLGHGRSRGYLRADLDVEATARVVNAMIFSVALEETRREATPEETQRIVDATLALYFGGVAA